MILTCLIQRSVCLYAPIIKGLRAVLSRDQPLSRFGEQLGEHLDGRFDGQLDRLRSTWRELQQATANEYVFSIGISETSFV